VNLSQHTFPMSHDTDLDLYFAGDKLYGDDFSLSQIREWYDDEKEAYANLGAKDAVHYTYVYHALNALHGFKYLPVNSFSHALGLGSAYGDEFAPLADRVKRVTILEPSDAFNSEVVHDIPARYIKPAVDGTLPFPDQTFDLITCLGVLHHIPNITYVVHELYRCLRPGGFALVREPMISMGDWRYPRYGLTKRERGIPLALFRALLEEAGFRVVNESLCVFPLMPKLWQITGKAAYNSRLATLIDKYLSRMFAWNLQYHATSFPKKLRPTSVYYVLTR